jgi:CDP-diacylglycerol---serine O-phosphatidyltransferase
MELEYASVNIQRRGDLAMAPVEPDPTPDHADDKRRRRGRRLFQRRQVPIRMLIPNFFTLLSLCAGLTAIRMALESRWDLALALVVLAGLLDGIDGRAARFLKAQSRFGAELDSLADFVNFGVAPALIVYTWGLAGNLKGFGWICVLVFAAGMGLRLARFNSMLDVEKPKWQGNFFTGMPAPAGAITVLMPLYLSGADIFDMRKMPLSIAIYTLAMAFLLVSTIPTFSGKQLGERIKREWVLPILVAVALVVAMLVTYPHETLLLTTFAYLAMIPFSMRRHANFTRQSEAQSQADAQRAAIADDPRVVEIRPGVDGR